MLTALYGAVPATPLHVGDQGQAFEVGPPLRRTESGWRKLAAFAMLDVVREFLLASFFLVRRFRTIYRWRNLFSYARTQIKSPNMLIMLADRLIVDETFMPGNEFMLASGQGMWVLTPVPSLPEATAPWVAPSNRPVVGFERKR